MTLTIGNPTMVDTDEISTLAEELASLSLECGVASAEASAARVVTAPPNASARWSSAGPRIERAADQLAAASDQAASLARALGATASLYLETESTVSGLFAMASSTTGAMGAALFGQMVLPLVGATALIGAPFIIPTVLSPNARQLLARTGSVLGSKVAGWLVSHPSVARNPATMMLVRGLVSGSDDAVKVALGMPPMLAPLVNDPKLSVPGAALGLGALGVIGLRESSVTVAPVGRSAVTAPTGVADLASRIPESSPGAPQIRIEEYDDSYVVYVGGTVDGGLGGGGDEAFDMESNAALMADADGGGYRAVEQAMAEAGISPDDPVTIVGHSQGGLIAERVTQSDKFNVQTLVTFGAPSTGADLPDNVNAYAVEHSGDVIPALGGFTDGGERVVVTGEVPDEGGDLLSAHHMSGYQHTAEQIDSSLDPRFAPLREALGDITGEGTSTAYHATRIDDPLPPEPVDGAAEPRVSSHSGPPVRPQDADLHTDKLVEGSVVEQVSSGASLEGDAVGGGGAADTRDIAATGEGSGRGNPIDLGAGAGTGSDAGTGTGTGTDADAGHDPEAGDLAPDEPLRESGNASGPHVDRLGPLPSPLPLPDEVIRP